MDALFSAQYLFIKTYKTLYLNFAEAMVLWKSLYNSSSMESTEVSKFIYKLDTVNDIRHSPWYMRKFKSEIFYDSEFTNVDKYIIDLGINNEKLVLYRTKHSPYEIEIFKKIINHFKYMRLRFMSLCLRIHNSNPGKKSVTKEFYNNRLIKNIKDISIDMNMDSSKLETLEDSCKNTIMYIDTIIPILESQIRENHHTAENEYSIYKRVHTVAAKLATRTIDNLYALNFIGFVQSFLSVVFDQFNIN